MVEDTTALGLFTVFAPTDDAFAAMDPADLDALRADPQAIRELLALHVAEGEFPAADLPPTVMTVYGVDVTIGATDDGSVTVDDATVVEADIEASNGVIHAIDSVLVLPRTPR